MPVKDLRQGPIILLDDSRSGGEVGSSYVFHSPEHIICAHDFAEVEAALKAIDKAYAKGLHVAGWVSYEAAAAFEGRIKRVIREKAPEPLIWMMATRHREVLQREDVAELIHASMRGTERVGGVDIQEPDLSEADYGHALEKIQSYILAGDIYQANFTFPLPLKAAGDRLALYAKLRRMQPVPYGAYIDTGGIDTGTPSGVHDRFTVLSLSPELFLARRGDRLLSQPMKGTAPRGRFFAEDTQIARSLQQDEKSRAENLMIVDLIRNDLSRLSVPGTVKTSDMFKVDAYPTLHQMTTSVQSVVREGVTPSAMLAAMFPCGSVTGAPKIRAMEVIAELERAPRGVYCGTIGFFSPGDGRGPKGLPNWQLNVPIRTLVLDDAGGGRFSIGSGVVADSLSDAEYDECLLKSGFLRAEPQRFDLIETLLLKAGTGSGPLEYTFLDRHLDRLKKSAAYFGFPFPLDGILSALQSHATAAATGKDGRKVRLVLSGQGAICVTSEEIGPEGREGTPLTVCLSDTRTDAADRFLFHKTTRRALYDSKFSSAREAGYADILFLNDRGEVTEGAISNFFVKKGDVFYTPPVASGLLAGVMRQDLLASDPDLYQEKTLGYDDLIDAEEIILTNSVRGIRRVTLDPVWL